MPRAFTITKSFAGKDSSHLSGQLPTPAPSSLPFSPKVTEVRRLGVLAERQSIREGINEEKYNFFSYSDLIRKITAFLPISNHSNKALGGYSIWGSAAIDSNSAREEHEACDALV